MSKLAATGLRRNQRLSRSGQPIGRARIGSPFKNRRRSSASSLAVGYRRAGDLAIAFRQIVSRSRGILSLSWRGGRGSSSITCMISIRRLPRNGPLAGEQLVEHDARAVNVGPDVDPVRLAARLLGRHVGRRAQHLPVLGHDGFLGLALGQAEVHQVRLALGIEQDVGGLDVAVDHAVAVGTVEGVANGRDQFRRFAERDRSAGFERAAQRRALDEFLDQVERAVLGLTGLVDRDDAGVLELGCAARFSQEPGCVFRAGEVAGPGNLDRHLAAELGVACPEDVAE